MNAVRDRTHWKSQEIRPARSGDPRPLQPDRSGCRGDYGARGQGRCRRADAGTGRARRRRLNGLLRCHGLCIAVNSCSIRLGKISGSAHETIDHPAVFTVEEAQGAYRPICREAHCKSLFLKDKKGGALAPGLPGSPPDRYEPAVQGARLSAGCPFGKPELLLEVLGVTPGSVTPFALINDAEHRVSAAARSKPCSIMSVLNYHPLTNEATTTIRAADLPRPSSRRWGIRRGMIDLDRRGYRPGLRPRNLCAISSHLS